MAGLLMLFCFAIVYATIQAIKDKRQEMLKKKYQRKLDSQRRKDTILKRGEEFIFDNGNKYYGEIKNHQPNGRGKMEYANGDSYEGEWENGSKEGNGMYYFKNGDKYDGNWLNNKRHGYGVQYFSNGNIGKGNWVNGKPDISGGNFYMYYSGSGDGCILGSNTNKAKNIEEYGTKDYEGSMFYTRNEKTQKTPEEFMDGVLNKARKIKYGGEYSEYHYIGVQFESKIKPGTFYGGTYAYKTKQNFHRGQIIDVPTIKGMRIARVLEENKDPRTISCNISDVKIIN